MRPSKPSKRSRGQGRVVVPGVKRQATNRQAQPSDKQARHPKPRPRPVPFLSLYPLFGGDEDESESEEAEPSNQKANGDGHLAPPIAVNIAVPPRVVDTQQLVNVKPEFEPSMWIRITQNSVHVYKETEEQCRQRKPIYECYTPRLIRSLTLSLVNGDLPLQLYDSISQFNSFDGRVSTVIEYTNGSCTLKREFTSLRIEPGLAYKSECENGMFQSDATPTSLSFTDVDCTNERTKQLLALMLKAEDFKLREQHPADKLNLSVAMSDEQGNVDRDSLPCPLLPVDIRVTGFSAKARSSADVKYPITPPLVSKMFLTNLAESNRPEITLGHTQDGKYNAIPNLVAKLIREKEPLTANCGPASSGADSECSPNVPKRPDQTSRPHKRAAVHTCADLDDKDTTTKRLRAIKYANSWIRKVEPLMVRSATGSSGKSKPSTSGQKPKGKGKPKSGGDNVTVSVSSPPHSKKRKKPEQPPTRVTEVRRALSSSTEEDVAVTSSSLAEVGIVRGVRAEDLVIDSSLFSPAKSNEAKGEAAPTQSADTDLNIDNALFSLLQLDDFNFDLGDEPLDLFNDWLPPVPAAALSAPSADVVSKVETEEDGDCNIRDDSQDLKWGRLDKNLLQFPVARRVDTSNCGSVRQSMNDAGKLSTLSPMVLFRDNSSISANTFSRSSFYVHGLTLASNIRSWVQAAASDPRGKLLYAEQTESPLNNPTTINPSDFGAEEGFDGLFSSLNISNVDFRVHHSVSTFQNTLEYGKPSLEARSAEPSDLVSGSPNIIHQWIEVGRTDPVLPGFGQSHSNPIPSVARGKESVLPGDNWRGVHNLEVNTAAPLVSFKQNASAPQLTRDSFTPTPEPTNSSSNLLTPLPPDVTEFFFQYLADTPDGGLASNNLGFSESVPHYQHKPLEKNDMPDKSLKLQHPGQTDSFQHRRSVTPDKQSIIALSPSHPNTYVHAKDNDSSSRGISTAKMTIPLVDTATTEPSCFLSHVPDQYAQQHLRGHLMPPDNVPSNQPAGLSSMMSLATTAASFLQQLSQKQSILQNSSLLKGSVYQSVIDSSDHLKRLQSNTSLPLQTQPNNPSKQKQSSAKHQILADGSYPRSRANSGGRIKARRPPFPSQVSQQRSVTVKQNASALATASPANLYPQPNRQNAAPNLASPQQFQLRQQVQALHIPNLPLLPLQHSTNHAQSHSTSPDPRSPSSSSPNANHSPSLEQFSAGPLAHSQHRLHQTQLQQMIRMQAQHLAVQATSQAHPKPQMQTHTSNRHRESMAQQQVALARAYLQAHGQGHGFGTADVRPQYNHEQS